MEADPDGIIADLLDDLIIKYLLNLPDEEYANEVQLCYAFQLAHWEYLDAPETEHLQQKLSFSNFVITVVDMCPELGLNSADVPKIVSMFNRQNWQIPVYGAMLINQSCDKVLLVQTLVKDKGGAWMFPRGKLEKRDHGSSFNCACREVYEETGFRMLDIAKNDADRFVERTIQAGNETKVVGLYLVPGVDEQFHFFSLTQGEVYQFAWFRISDLMNQMKKEKPIYIDGKAAKFVQVHPFLNSLNAFAQRLRKQQRGAQGGPAPAQQLQEAPAAWGFDEMLQLNQGLQAQRPYDGVLPQNQKAQAAKQRKRGAGQGFAEAQEQAVQLAKEATQLAAEGRNKPGADYEASALNSLNSESSSLSARREPRRRGKRRRCLGGETAKEQVDAAVKDRREGGGADGRGNVAILAAGSVMSTLVENWEPVQLKLPEIKWQGVQVCSGTVAAAREGVSHGHPSQRPFTLNTGAVFAALDAALRPRPVS